MTKKLFAFALALSGTGCHRQAVQEKYPPVFAPASPLSAYGSSQTGYPLKSPRASVDPAFRDPIFAPTEGTQPDTFLSPAGATGR